MVTDYMNYHDYFGNCLHPRSCYVHRIAQIRTNTGLRRRERLQARRTLESTEPHHGPEAQGPYMQWGGDYPGEREDIVQEALIPETLDETLKVARPPPEQENRPRFEIYRSHTVHWNAERPGTAETLKVAPPRPAHESRWGFEIYRRPMVQREDKRPGTTETTRTERGVLAALDANEGPYAEGLPVPRASDPSARARKKRGRKPLPSRRGEICRRLPAEVGESGSRK